MVPFSIFSNRKLQKEVLAFHFGRPPTRNKNCAQKKGKKEGEQNQNSGQDCGSQGERLFKVFSHKNSRKRSSKNQLRASKGDIRFQFI